jgi:glutathione peroxidase
MPSAFDFTFKKLARDETFDLKTLDGKVLLVVNVASACGYTSQYRELESLFEAKQAKGLVVIGVPCNEFGRQEAGDEDQIAAFCGGQYQVSFPMTGKVEIIGPGRHPFYRWISAELGEDGLPKWNFHKWLVGRDGRIMAAYPSAVAPLDPLLIRDVERSVAR